MQEVTPIAGERFCYTVLSRSTGGAWRVDLEAYGGNGACDCPNFQFACRPALENGARPSMSLRCYHIKRTILFAWDDLFPALLTAMTEGKL